MSSIAIYMEGGGDGRDTKAALSQGMDFFLTPLKDAARAKSWRWKLVCCGGRNAAFDAFRNAILRGDDTIVSLLVDAEAPLNDGARAHLQARDGWNIEFAPEHVVHLMVETMEAWIVADPDALEIYYGAGFRRAALPKVKNLENVSKVEIAESLDRATNRTRKGAYHKIRHASDLLKRIDPAKVERRCSRCARMFSELGHAIRAA